MHTVSIYIPRFLARSHMSAKIWVMFVVADRFFVHKTAREDFDCLLSSCPIIPAARVYVIE